MKNKSYLIYKSINIDVVLVATIAFLILISFLIGNYIHPYLKFFPFVLLAFITFLLISSKPRLLLPLLTFIVFFQYICYRTEYNQYFVIWDEILVGVFALLVFLKKILTNEPIHLPPFNNYILALFFINILSMILNNSMFLPGLMAMRFYFQYILFFYALLNTGITNSTINKTIKIIFLCFILQYPLIAYQLFKIIQKGEILGVDSFYGSFPGANSLSYACLFPIFIFLGMKKMKYFHNIVILFLLIFLMILGQGRFAIILFPLGVGYLYLIKHKNDIKLFSKIFISVSLILTFLLFYGFVITRHGVSIVRDYYRIFDKSYLYPGTIWWKLAYYPVTYKFLTQAGLTQVLFGFGPGMYGSYAGMKYNTPYTQVLSNIFQQQTRGIARDVASEIIVIWGELGFIGLFVYLLLLFKILKFAVNCYKKFSNDDLVQGLSSGLIIGSFIMIIGSFVNQVFETQVISYPYWLLTALLIKIAKNTNEKC